jgi:hypothetical protein
LTHRRLRLDGLDDIAAERKYTSEGRSVVHADARATQIC